MKKGKSKKNWFKVQFEKHPYLYSVLLVWTIFIVPGLNGFYRSWSNKTGNTVVLILFLFTFATFFLWFRKNKSKIKPFYKRNKKIFNRVYFYLGSVFSLIPIACIVGIIVTGGFSNFIERAKFEINAAIWTYSKYDYCQSPFLVSYSGYPKDNRIYFLKEATQYLDYFENQIDMNVLRDLDFLNFNHCTSTRYLLKEAQKGKYEKDREVAKEILVAYPPELRDLYSFPLNLGENNKYIFSRYEKNIANMDLDNPAIAYSYAVYLDKNIDWSLYKNEIKTSIKPEALKYLTQSAEDGYFISMMTWLVIHSNENNFDKNNCDTYLKYINTLADNNSLIPYYTLMQGYMGKIGSGFAKTVFKCLDKKPSFSKAFSMLSSIPFDGSQRAPVKKSNNFLSSYPAIFYLYGLEDVEQDYDKAYELFSYSEDAVHSTGIPDHAYLAYMNYMGMGVEQNQNKGKGLAIELAKKMSLPVKIKQMCNLKVPNLLVLEPYWGKKLSKRDREKKRIKYNEDKKINEKITNEYRDKLGRCLLESEHEVSIKFLEDYIYNRMSEWFKNPELVKTLNYLGEPK